MQCKNIPDEPILKFLLERGRDGLWCNWGLGNDRDVIAAMPANTPPKLALAKMRSLVGRGLVVGCTCGCRGDFELTQLGRIKAHENKKQSSSCENGGHEWVEFNTRERPEVFVELCLKCQKTRERNL